MANNYIKPEFELDGFNCPHCNAYAHQTWFHNITGNTGPISHGYFQPILQGFSISRCVKCNNYSIWNKNKMVFPRMSIAPLPTEDMPDEIKEDFLEAKNIIGESPRASAALIRLALQKLMKYLGEKGDNLNQDIANLVEKGLPEKIQKALDSVRVIGNNAVHPGQIDFKENMETALALFNLLNMIVEVMITQSKKVAEIYQGIPDSAKEQIKKRNGKE